MHIKPTIDFSRFITLPCLVIGMNDYGTVSLTFTGGPTTTVLVSVDVIDDVIFEADEEYFILFLETNDTRVDLSTGRFAARGIIRDDESM